MTRGVQLYPTAMELYYEANPQFSPATRRNWHWYLRQLQRQQNNVGPCQDIITRPPDPIAVRACRVL